jgi:ribulose 1,5-bisphosphate synthetase/thiazole synthase
MHRLSSPILLLIAMLQVSAAAAAEPPVAADVVIYGGTSGAIAAALQAKAMGKSVVVVSPDRHLGGLSSGGLGWTDSGRKEVVGGLAREFYRRLKRHYDKPEAWVHQQPEDYKHYVANADAIWVFEPKVAEAAFEAWVKEQGIPVVRDAWLDREQGVVKEGERIISITTLDGRTFAGKMFIDATYEGDLMAAAGVSFTTGREANAVYGESLNGVQTKRATSHQFTNKISPYVVPDDPASGLLPRIHDGSPGEEGEGDHRIQAYNFRLCMTDVPANRVAFPKPAGYDPRQYELLLRDLQAGSRHVFRKFDPVPNGKTDTNNSGSFSTDNIGMNYDYPEASYERRREIIAEHAAYQQGYYWFLINDPRVPEDVRTTMGQWGLAKDEFLDNGHWPHQIYVREARRMVADFVVAEPHLRRQKPTPDSVGMGSYNMDSHHVQRYVAHDEDGRAYARNEGDIQVSPGGPYPVSYRAIVPKVGECENLLVPVAMSASHIAYGSIRMEPVFMILGQSAATAAALAIDGGMAVQQVPYAALRERLLADGQVLEFNPASP